MGPLLSCCRFKQGNAEECAPLVNKSQKRQYLDASPGKSILANIPAPSEFLDPALAELINNLSSGDDDPMDPAQEEKYELILKGIED